MDPGIQSWNTLICNIMIIFFILVTSSWLILRGWIKDCRFFKYIPLLVDKKMFPNLLVTHIGYTLILVWMAQRVLKSR